MKTIPLAPILASLAQAHYALAYAQAGFNIHDSSDGRHEVATHEATIEALFDTIQGQCSEADLDINERSYVRGYAAYARDHNVFSKKLSKRKNESHALTPVSCNTDVNFEGREGWHLFCDVYEELVAAKKAEKRSNTAS